ncbi:S9 family peptidase [Aliidiomarina sedimenti]|uniref:S9 family peptidase n=1 Tax=Aliidiomarina sedimenti TaxID=1933879 RepID=A0ABY0C2G8_9GAMM|nr:prolyl oligopeptidase family serine peptidase [Aliidiomarina sedimenti]RUO31929.1 S9 family peptidase [Aliidiomarina sedimenti]
MQVTHLKTKLAIAVAATLMTVSCASTDQSSAQPTERAATEYQAQAQQTGPRNETSTLTLERIMADQDWVARSPESAYWSYDGSQILFERKRQGSPMRDLYVRDLTADGNGERVALAQLHGYAHRDAVVNDDQSMHAYVFENNIFVRDLRSGELSQLTGDAQSKTALQFLHDGRLSYRVENRLVAIEPASGRRQTLLTLAFSDEPEATQEPADLIAEEEIDLMEYNQIQRRQRTERFEHQQQLAAQNSTLAPQPFYMGEGMELVDLSLSPAGDKAIVVITEPQSWRADGDLMPRYVTETGRIENQDVRRRVADAKPVEHQMYVLDLDSGEKQALGFDSLPGFDEDVLASVREENYAARGETYRSERKPRAINLMAAWSAPQGNINWNHDGSQVAVMLRAWDNKDRWIATVNFDDARLVSQHRLHDEAWINRDYNDFDWVPGQNALWYGSEEDGYGHLYVRNLDSGRSRQLTQGQYVVNNVVSGQDGDYLYYTANQPHPGVYEVYRVAISSGDIEQLTDLGGINTFALSPDESQLLITHSTAVQPHELYLQELGASNAERLTHTVSDEFNSIPWKKGDIVAVPSSHVDEPIYSRVYLPDDFDPNQAEGYPAVVFIHGAGYLQNAHSGWSNYSREFMFHNMLTQQGYVVLDLDFRGSKGYGRDWRTAVYRQMGTPEVEDLVDVVSWMGDQVNVDTSRVGTYGGSYGGFLTFMSLFKEPDLFQAGAALRPVTDWAHYNTGYTSNILNLPQDDMIAYRRSSPIYFAEQYENTPMLINAPMVDDNVFFQDSVRLVQRLIELEKENFETAIFPVEPHGFVQPSSWLNQYRRIHKLFESNLK